MIPTISEYLLQNHNLNVHKLEAKIKKIKNDITIKKAKEKSKYLGDADLLIT